MTIETLDKGNSLMREIDFLESNLKKIQEHKNNGRKLKGTFAVGLAYEVEIHPEITKKVETLLEVELATMLEEKRQQFAELGAEPQQQEKFQYEDNDDYW